MIGEVIGSYRVTGALGVGGMGEVFVAEHVRIGRRAALKVLLPEMSRDRVMVTRFFNEAHAASAARHPGIVEILDSGYHTNGRAFILMEHLEGETLHERLGRLHVLPLAMALHFTRQVASALVAAHGAGVVHRDLKPENLFIVADPEVVGGERIKLLDFGIAKLAGGMGTGVKTHTGMVMGTPAYMSPEQCKGAGQVDHRADLYALGCLLFRLVCGRPPFVAEGSGEVLAQQIYAPPPRPSSLVPRLPEELDALILALLAKAPGARVQSAQVLVAALDALLAEHGAGRMPTQPPGSLSLRATASATTLSASAGALLLPGRRGRPRWRVIAPVAVIVLGMASGGLYAVLGRGGSAEPASAAPAADARAMTALAERPGADEPASAAPEAYARAVTAPAERPASGPVLPATPAPDEPRRGPEPARASRVRIDSEPRAEIVLGGERVGRTPLTVEVPAGEERAYVLRRDGYAEVTVRVPANVIERAPVRVALERAARERERPERPQRRRPRGAPEAGADDARPGAATPPDLPRAPMHGNLSEGGSLPF